MGTNYYWKPGKEHRLAAAAPLHIGKASGGWEFSFQAYEVKGAENTRVTIGEALSIVMDTRPFALSIRSWKDWQALLAQGGTVEDEYDSEVSLADFVKMVETLKPGGTWATPSGPQLLLSHVAELRNGFNKTFYDPLRDWVDSAGYSFSLSDFR
jgi:hypothetical protein